MDASAIKGRLDSVLASAADGKKVPAIGAIILDKSGQVLYKGAFGTTDLSNPSAPPYTSTTDTLLWSCTKVVTVVAALQLLEQGKIKLDDPVEKYVPKYKNIQVLDGFQDDGTPNYRAPKTTANILHLMTHTVGFSYDFFDVPTLRWRITTDHPPASYANGKAAAFNSPLMCDPGTQYIYGVGIDWLGFVVETVSGMRLNEYYDQFILHPLGMKNSQFWLKDNVPSLKLHMRGEDGSLVTGPDLDMREDVEIYSGGGALVSTLEDYSAFLLTLLAGGTHPVSKVKILEETTVKEYLFSDQIHKICSNKGIGEIEASIPQVSNVGTFLPGVKKGWSCGLMLNSEATPKGRSAGSGSWAGLGNNYYWIDPVAGKLGLVMSTILPFFDEVVLQLADEVERAAYSHDAAAKGGDENSNYHITGGIGKIPTSG